MDEARGTLPSRVRYLPSRPDGSVADILPHDAIPDGDGWRFQLPPEGIEGLLVTLI